MDKKKERGKHKGADTKADQREGGSREKGETDRELDGALTVTRNINPRH